jgi:4-amino-4-deoxy-L-arabinose transferase-like glycosyltransferase
LRDGHALSLHLNGHPYPDKPPLYFWYVTPFAWLFGTGGPPAFFLASGVAGLLLLLATRWLARRTGVGSPSVALLAPLLVLVTPLFQLLLRTTRMDLLFATFILLAQGLLFRGLEREGRRPEVVLGLLAAGVATLIKGPFGIAIPLAGAALYLLWRGRLARLLARDVALGLLGAGAVVALWAVGICVAEGTAYFEQLVREQVVGRTVAARAHREPPWFYALALPATWLPWTLLLVALPGLRLLSGDAWRRGWRRGREGASGRGWLLAMAAGGFLVLSLASGKLVIYAMPLLPPLAVLTADALLGLPERAFRRFALAAAVAGLAAGVALPFGNAWHAWDVWIEGLVPAGVVLALGGAALLLWRRRQVVLGTTIGTLCAFYLLVALVVAPSLDPVMSPRAQAEVLRRAVDAGYAPLVFRTYGGTYAYHADRVLPETDDLQVLAEHVRRGGPVVVTMAEKYWQRHADLLRALRPIHRQYVEGRPFVVLASEGPPLDLGERPSRVR